MASRPARCAHLVTGAFALLLTALAFAAPPHDNPLLGRWEYVPAGSKFSGRAPYRSATITFTIEGSSVRVAEEVITANGAKFRFEYLDPEDGTYVTVAGNPYYDSESTTWQDARTAIRKERRAGQEIGTTVMTVSSDGETFVAHHERIVPEGLLYTAEVNWKRVDR